MNILIVEDEPPTLRQLAHYIQKFGEPYRVFAHAYDGQSAKDIVDCSADKIDFIITDIQIPLLNGLELVEYVKERYPHILCSVLTGYDDFAYAQKALRLKIFDYILKPIEEGVLRCHLTEVYEHKCLRSLGSGVIKGSSDSLSASEPFPCAYRQILIHTGCLCSSANSISDDEKKLNSILKRFCKYFTKFWIIPHKSNGYYFVLFSFSESQVSDCSFFYHDVYHSILTSFPDSTMVTSDSPVTLDTLENHIQALYHYSEEKILFAQPSFICMPTDNLKNSSLLEEILQVPTDDITRLSKLFISRSRIMFHTELNSFLLSLKTPTLTQAVLKVYLTALFTQCTLPYLSNPSIRKMDFHAIIENILAHSESYSALYTNLAATFDDIYAAAANELKEVTGKSNMLLQINAYIEKYYTNPINTKVIADKFGFTPAYLSKLFREYKQITPSEYISQLRIDKAKKLLKSSHSLSIKEIADVVGYDDPLYFSKVFKKLTGTTPKAYQYEQVQ